MLHVCVCVCVHFRSYGRGCGAASSGVGAPAGSCPAADAEQLAETAASPSSPSPCTTETGSQQSSTMKEETRPVCVKHVNALVRICILKIQIFESKQQVSEAWTEPV